MTGHFKLLALALLLLLAAPAGALKWTKAGAPVGNSGWRVSMLPSGVGYAASRDGLSGDWFDDIYRTADEGRTWQSVPLSNVDGIDGRGVFSVEGTGQLLVEGWAAGSAQYGGFDNSLYRENRQLLIWSPATGRWTNRTLPKAGDTMYIRAMVPVPGSNQAFALGQVYLSDKEFVLYRSGAAGAAWKIIKSLKRDSNQFFEDLVVASSTAAWVSYRVPGKNYASTVDIDRWNGTAWVKQRTGRSDDQEVGFLKAVPAVGSTPAAVWVKVITTEPTWTETLLLCHAAGCTSKKTVKGSLEAFGAASANFAMVWETIWSATTYTPTTQLQHFDGAKWITKLKLPVPGMSAKLSVVSASRAVSLWIFASPSSMSKLVITHSWNGASWTRHTNATVPNSELDAPALHALDSGSALLQLRTSLWRLG